MKTIRQYSEEKNLSLGTLYNFIEKNKAILIKEKMLFVRKVFKGNRLLLIDDFYEELIEKG